MNRLLTLTWLCFLLPFTNMAQHNHQHEKHCISQRTETSDIVIEGKIIAQNSFWDDERKGIFTNNKIEVFKIFKGSDVDTITITTRGGTIDNQFQIVPHFIQLNLFEEGIFFCKTYNMPRFSKEKLMLKSSNGFIKYHFANEGFSASDEGYTYSDVKNEVLEHIKLHSDSEYIFKKNNQYESYVEEWLTQSFSVTVTDTIIEFSFENIDVIGINEVEFDVMVKSNQEGIKFAASDVFFNYSTEAFGESVVVNERISASKETVIENAVYALDLTDESVDIVRLIVSSQSQPTQFYPLSLTKEKFIHVSIDIENIFELASIQFDDILMGDQSFFYDELTGEYISFDRVSVDDPILPFLLPSIDTIYPDIITVGTGDILTIEGIMFGDIKGKVKFNSAEATGPAMIESNDADVTWSDTSITVRMPSFPTAGSGAVVIITDDSMTDTSDILLVKYGVLNTRQLTNEQAHRVHLTGGTFDNIFFSYEDTITEIQTVSPIIDIIELALKKWQCNTGVKWSLLGESSYHTADLSDGTNLIYMADESEFVGDAEDLIAYNVLSGYITQCGGSVKYYVSDMDIAIRETENWWYDTTAVNSLVPDSVRDFQTLILHELGHSHKLTHVREGFKVMHPEFDLGESRRVLSPFDVEGGLNVIDSSQNLMVDCVILPSGQDIVPIGQEFPTDCGSLPVEEVSSLNHYLVYPTIFQDQLNIELELNVATEVRLKLFDLLGQEVYRKDVGKMSADFHAITLQTSHLQTSAIYFLQAEINNQTITRKVIKL